MWKESAYGDRKALFAAQLATHLEEGGDFDRAVLHRIQAGRQALDRGANREAIAHLERALNLLGALPPTAARKRQELAVRVMLGTPLLMTEGYTSSRVQQTFARAFELASRRRRSPQSFPALFGLYRYTLLSGKLKQARQLALQMLRVAEREPGRPRWSTALLAHGAVLFHQGEFAAALAGVEECLRAYRDRTHGRQVLEQGEDDACVALTYAMFALQAMGDVAGASARAEELEAHAAALDHPWVTVQAHGQIGYLCVLRRNSRETLEHAEACLSVAREHGLAPLWIAGASIQKGWALATQGVGESALALMREGLAGLAGGGIRLWETLHCACLAEACMMTGHVDDARRVIEEALANAAETGEHCFLAEVLRWSAEISLRHADALTGDITSQAQAAFHAAISLARQQQAKLFELRATSGLARLLASQGLVHEAREAMTDICSRFADGCNCVELIGQPPPLEGM
jgi:tetratricopeptide (TPR) repeat protein